MKSNLSLPFKRFRHITHVTAMALSFMLSGCLESTITQTCTSMAEERCATCYQCATGIDVLTGGALCGVGTSTSQTECVTELVEVCEDQTNARQLNVEDLDSCEQSLIDQADQCEPHYEYGAQGHSSLPSECTRFF